MNRYQFNDVIFMKKGKVLPVENGAKEQIGFIKVANIPECEKGSSFSFTTTDDSTVFMGIKKRGFKNLLVPTYVIKAEEKDYTLKDKVGNNFLYFCVEGSINDQRIRIEENWSENVEVFVDRVHIATIKVNGFSLKTTIQVKDKIDESSILFSVIFLMYFMYQIYKDESGLIEDLLFD